MSRSNVSITFIPYFILLKGKNPVSIDNSSLYYHLEVILGGRKITPISVKKRYTPTLFLE